MDESCNNAWLYLQTLMPLIPRDKTHNMTISICMKKPRYKLYTLVCSMSLRHTHIIQAHGWGQPQHTPVFGWCTISPRFSDTYVVFEQWTVACPLITCQTRQAWLIAAHDKLLLFRELSAITAGGGGWQVENISWPPSNT